MLNFKNQMLSVLYDEFLEDTGTQYKVRIDDMIHYLPQSQCELMILIDGSETISGSVQVPRWLVEKLRLDPYVEE